MAHTGFILLLLHVMWGEIGTGASGEPEVNPLPIPIGLICCCNAGGVFIADTQI